MSSSARSIWLRVLAIAVVASFSVTSASRAAEQNPAELMRRGADAFARGDLGAAEREWKAADSLYEKHGDTAGRLDAWLSLGAVQQQAGKFGLAENTLGLAEDLATKSDLPDKLIGIKNAQGVLYTFTRRPELGEAALNEAKTLAESRNADAGVVVAGIRNNLGNLYASWAEVLTDKEQTDAYAKAFEHYVAGADVAKKSGDATLAAKATANAALSAARGGQFDKANDFAGQVARLAKDLPDSADKANLLITAGQADQLVLAAKPASVDVGIAQRRAFNGYESARTIAASVGNPLIGSYAVGYQGHLYEMAGRFDESLTLTRRAVAMAQQAQSDDSLYLWLWQVGRICKAQGRNEDAIIAYSGARDTLQRVRSDQALGYGNRGLKSTFRSEVGPLYYELADLLLARADATTDAARVQQSLSDARNTVERLRVGELESYLQDPCVNQAQAAQVDLTRELGKIPSGNPAVVYLIPLSNRIEILLTTRQGMRRIKVADVGSEQLTEEVRTFRERLETRRNHRYLTNAKQLYTWLIAPIEPILQSEKIDTLVFVPDGALRTVPMSALHDGTDFLVAKYAVAVSPGLSLSLSNDDPASVSRSAAKVLASGLSEQGTDKSFAALPSVEGELSTIQKLYGATTLLNERFQVPALTTALTMPGEEEYSIVHIASHGVFAPNIKDTFILTYDGKLDLTSLEGLLRRPPGKSIDLLALSACETSAGDDQAALERASLGLGGLAVKAGARSAMASLWFANDQATGELVTAFYTELRDHPEAGKAKALREAQLKLIRGDSFNHPVYWAPFLMIGDWL